jgi:hypothetical protein
MTPYVRVPHFEAYDAIFFAISVKWEAIGGNLVVRTVLIAQT